MFCEFNFRSWYRATKNFGTERFPIYGYVFICSDGGRQFTSKNLLRLKFNGLFHPVHAAVIVNTALCTLDCKYGLYASG